MHVCDPGIRGLLACSIVAICALLPFGVAGCGDADPDDGTAAPVRLSSKLTSNLPPAVKGDCRYIESRMPKRQFLCPAVVPKGKTYSQNNRRTIIHGTEYVVNYVCSLLGGNDPQQPRGERNHVGHWFLAGGSPADIQEIISNRGVKPSGGFSVDGTEVRLFDLKYRYYALDAGHVFAIWRLGGRAYELSMHGFENRSVLVAMARTYVSQMVAELG